MGYIGYGTESLEQLDGGWGTPSNILSLSPIGDLTSMVKGKDCSKLSRLLLLDDIRYTSTLPVLMIPAPLPGGDWKKVS